MDGGRAPNHAHSIHLTIVVCYIRVVGHARGRDLTGLKNDKKNDFVNFTLMATENYWFNCNEIYNQ